MRKSYCEISTVNRITLWGEWIVTSLFAASPNSDLTALPITEGGTAIREQRTLTERIRKAADHFIKTPTIQSNHRSDHIFHYINHLIKKKKEKKWSEVKAPFEVFKTMEGDHGSHPLTGGRQRPLQEEFTALTTHCLKLSRIIHRSRQSERGEDSVCVWVQTGKSRELRVPITDKKAKLMALLKFKCKILSDLPDDLSLSEIGLCGSSKLNRQEFRNDW